MKTKRERPSAARDLYESALFKRRRWYAERRGVPWFVLSAEFGLVAPDEWLSPYDLELGATSMEYRAAWAMWCVARLERMIGSLVGLAVEVHAGEAYAFAIEGPLADRGAQVTVPLKGLGLGEQLAWYDRAGPVENLVEGPPGGVSSHATVTAPGGARDVVTALLDFRETLDVNVAVPLAGHREADRLLDEDPFAFLLGVIFDEGIRAERAWMAPYLLKERLGHLDPRLMSGDLAVVRSAVEQRPALHRYVERIPRAVCEAAVRVCEEYGGDASRIWADGSTVRQVDERLRRFRLIGQKKAAMAVEILLGKYRKSLAGISGTDVAYDVHVRRVFLRAGIVEHDEVEAVVNAARRLFPAEPGRLDLPTWVIGREWCRPSSPDCSGCPLGEVCPRLIRR